MANPTGKYSDTSSSLTASHWGTYRVAYGNGRQEPATLRASPQLQINPGDTLPLAFDRARIHCFGVDGRSL